MIKWSSARKKQNRHDDIIVRHEKKSKTTNITYNRRAPSRSGFTRWCHNVGKLVLAAYTYVWVCSGMSGVFCCLFFSFCLYFCIYLGYLENICLKQRLLFVVAWYFFVCFLLLSPSFLPPAFLVLVFIHQSVALFFLFLFLPSSSFKQIVDVN